MTARAAPREHSARVRGVRIAWRQWGEDHERPVLALHGWLDNAASFDALGPLLPGCRLIALDLPGHGLSEHRSADGSYNIWDDLPDLVWLVRELGLERYALIGHSRGAAVATLLAAIEAPAVSSLVLLDNMLAPLLDAADTARQLRDFAHDYGSRRPRGAKVFPSAAAAVEARCAATGIDPRAAQLLVARSLQAVEGGFRWRTDGRLRYASALKLGREHVRAVLGGLQLPALLLMATRGMGARLRAHEGLGWLPGLAVVEIDGCHHCHMLDEAPAVAAHISEFWRTCGEA